MKTMQGCILSVIIPITLVCVHFDPTIPTYFFNFILVLFEWYNNNGAFE